MSSNTGVKENPAAGSDQILRILRILKDLQPASWVTEGPGRDFTDLSIGLWLAY